MSRCSSTIHCWSVWPINMFGRPDEKPSSQITAMRRERKIPAHSRILGIIVRPLRAGKICCAAMATLADDILDKLTTELAKFPGVATTNDHYLALAYTVRDR